MIATTAALSGIEVVFLEPTEEKVANAFARIEAKLDKRIENWGLTQSEKRAVMGRIRGTLDYKDFEGATS